jgi:hypothetical protein
MNTKKIPGKYEVFFHKFPWEKPFPSKNPASSPFRKKIQRLPAPSMSGSAGAEQKQKGKPTLERFFLSQPCHGHSEIMIRFLDLWGYR